MEHAIHLNNIIMRVFILLVPFARILLRLHPPAVLNEASKTILQGVLKDPGFQATRHGIKYLQGAWVIKAWSSLERLLR